MDGRGGEIEKKKKQGLNEMVNVGGGYGGNSKRIGIMVAGE